MTLAATTLTRAGTGESTPLHIVLRCAKVLLPKVQYVFDTLLMARGIAVRYSDLPPAHGIWLFYGPAKEMSWPFERCLAICHCTEASAISRRPGRPCGH